MIFGACLCALTCVFVACSDDVENPYAHESGIKVVSSDLLFPGESSEGSVVVDATGMLTASSTSSWLTATVDGNTIRVAVTANERFDGRTAMLTISNGSDSIDVVVQQAGLNLIARTDSAIMVKDATEARKFYLHASAPVRIETSDTWISGQMEGDSLVVAMQANTTGRIRTGWLKYYCGPAVDSVMVTQGSYDDLVGDYYLAGYLNEADGSPISDVVTLRRDAAGKPEVYFPTFDWTWPAEFDEETLTLSLASGVCIGTYANPSTGATNYVGTVMWELDTNNIIYSQAVTMSAQFGLLDDGSVTAAIVDNGSWAGMNPTAIRFELFRSKNINRLNRLGQQVFALVQPFLMEKE